MKESKAVKKLKSLDKKMKPSVRLSKDPREATLEQKMLDISGRAKKEGIK